MDSRGRGLATDLRRKWGKTDVLDYIRDNDRKSVREEGGSNTNFTILGLVIEAVTGKTAVSEVWGRVFTPLGLSTSYIDGFGEQPSDTSSLLASRYHWSDATFRETAGIHPAFEHPSDRQDLINTSCGNYSMEWMADGVVSTPSSLCKFLVASRDGVLLSKASLEIMMDWGPMKTSSHMQNGLGLKRLEQSPGVWHVVGSWW